MKLSDIFSEFANEDKMNWFSDKPLKSLYDKSISSSMILRYYDNKFTIYYLTSGTKVIIPREYISLFYRFYSRFGNKIEAYKKEIQIEDKLDEFIYSFSSLSRSIILTGSVDKLKQSLENIIHLGTEVFRSWVQDEFEIDLLPVDFVDRNIIKEI